MAVAWLGNREATLEQAATRAADMLKASRCPVISLDTDVHGTRAAIALAERSGAAYDVAEPAAMREAALISGAGAMTIAPGEARQRGDLLVQVGDMPAYANDLLRELAASVPDLSPSKRRALFVVGSERTKAFGGGKATVLSCGRTGVSGTLAALCAQLSDRQVSRPVANFVALASALQKATFPVFLFSGSGAEMPALVMLQGLVADLNKTKRASSLQIPSNENAWGTVLASGWVTGFAPRTSITRGFPQHDPWRFDISRMIADGEADLILQVGGALTPKLAKEQTLVCLAATSAHHPGAAVTIAIGEPVQDHDAVRFSARTGTLVAHTAQAPSALPSAAVILRAIEKRVRAKAVA